MRLSEREFKAMNNPVRRLFQRRVEYPLFKRWGLNEPNRDILEIGCGSGYGAMLLSALQPSSYVGVDLMEDQIALARQLKLEGAEFMVRDASDLSIFPDESKDVVVIFGVLHHIPEWRAVLKECFRALRSGGNLFVEEPDGGVLITWDRLFHWGHPDLYPFRLADFEIGARSMGFHILKRLRGPGFGVYALLKP